LPVICGDCKEVIKRMDENSVDSIVTDPPAGIKFMGKSWDHDKGGRDQWIEWMTGIATECLRVIKPGGHALVWSLPRTSHWTATAWEDGGFEVRDSIVHIFGTGFPKSRNISKDLDLVMPAAPNRRGVSLREMVSSDKDMLAEWHVKNGLREHQGSIERSMIGEHTTTDNKPVSDAAIQWNGWGTALKPAHEDWILLRKPVEGTIAQNVLEYGVGGINIDGCRVEGLVTSNPLVRNAQGFRSNGLVQGDTGAGVVSSGRFPANLIHDGSDEVLALFPQAMGMSGGGAKDKIKKDTWAIQPFNRKLVREEWIRCDSGSAARFFYCAKPSPSERNIGCENLPHKTAGECTDRVEGSAGLNSPRAGAGRTNGSKNDHPTVKSISLMRYLCKLITPPNGVVLDPFCGSGSTGLAAYLEGFQCIMIDSDSHFCEIAEARMKGIIKGNNKLS